MSISYEKRKAYNDAWRAANPGKSKVTARESRYRALFGITIKDYEALLARQGGVCALCKNAETAMGSHGEVRRMSVDHCHATGVVRGLLCYNCNLMLGRAKDNVDLLRAAAVYLEVANTGFKVSAIPSADELLTEIMKL